MLIHLLCEAMNENKDVVTLKVQWMMQAMEEEKAGSTVGFHKDFSEEESSILLTNMRKRQVQIVRWFSWLVEQLESS